MSRCEPTGAPALVVGSAQPVEVADAPALARTGTTLVRRRSGGGAVLVAPGAQLWVDVWVPAGDELWDADVVRGAFWLGDVWAAALTRLGAEELHVHHGRAEGGEWSALVCFAGRGPGELFVSGRKLVGLAQRRTAAGIRLSTMALVEWRPQALLELLALPEPERARAEAELSGAAAGLAPTVPGLGASGALTDGVFDAVVASLPPAA